MAEMPPGKDLNLRFPSSGASLDFSFLLRASNLCLHAAAGLGCQGATGWVVAAGSWGQQGVPVPLHWPHDNPLLQVMSCVQPPGVRQLGRGRGATAQPFPCKPPRQLFRSREGVRGSQSYLRPPALLLLPVSRLSCGSLLLPPDVLLLRTWRMQGCPSPTFLQRGKSPCSSDWRSQDP